MPSQPNGDDHRRLRQSIREGVPSEVQEVSGDPMLDRAKVNNATKGDRPVMVDWNKTRLILHPALPALLSWGAILSLIFGGCCSNVGLPGD